MPYRNTYLKYDSAGIMFSSTNCRNFTILLFHEVYLRMHIFSGSDNTLIRIDMLIERQMKDKIMILGAGVYQLPLIKRAKMLGLETVIVTPMGNYPGIALADIHLDIDTTDSDKILKAARDLSIAGAVTSGTDVSIPALGAVADALGLIGPSKKAADTVSSKTNFRDFLTANGMNCPKHFRCRSPEDAWNFARKEPSRKVIKPDDSSGSRGVTILDCSPSERDVKDAYDHARSFSRSGIVCAETFIPGTEVGGDAFFVDGELRFFSTTCKHMHGIIVQGHSLPGVLSEKTNGLIRKELCRLSLKLGYRSGPVNFDVIVNDRDAVFLEIGLRNGGNGIIDIIYHSSGVDLTEWLLAYALGNPIPEHVIPSTNAISSYVFGAEHSGRLESISTLQELTNIVPEAFDMVLAKEPGDQVNKFIHNANLIGYLLLKCGAAEYEQVTEKIRDVMNIEVSNE